MTVVVAAQPSAAGGDGRGGTWLRIAALVASLVIHALLVRWGARLPEPSQRRYVDVELRPVEQPRPVAPSPELAPPPPPPPKRIPVVRRVPTPVVPPPQSPPPEQPPPTAEPPPEAPKVGIDEASTTPGGSMAVATGATLEGKVGTGTAMKRGPAAASEGTANGTGRGVFVPIYAVSRLPRPKQPIVPEVPESFRREPREALVVVEVEIDARGKVLSVRVVRKAGFGLDEAVVAAVRRTEFEPALVGEKPVGVRQQIPFRFRARG